MNHRQLLIQALASGVWKDRVINLSSGERWNLEEVYQAVCDLQPVEMPSHIFDVQSYHFKKPSETPDVPILIGMIDGTRFVLDGMHRIATAMKAKQPTILAYVITEQSTRALLLDDQST